MCLPRIGKVVTTSFDRRHGWNRKFLSEQPELLSLNSLFSGLGLTSYECRRTHNNETKLPVPFLRREVAGGERLFGGVMVEERGNCERIERFWTSIKSDLMANYTPSINLNLAVQILL